tara:strand:+ start:1049 stop:1381 length:333 start_codon:yes stop_codon:yes gene_type:complete
MNISNFNFIHIILISLLFVLTNCTTNNAIIHEKPVVIKKEEKKTVIEKKSCSEKSRVTVAKETFIQFRHDISEVEEYRKVAADWCDKFSKIPIKGKLKCGRCCDASYFCK